MKSLVFLFCAGLGYLIGHFFGDGPWVTYISMMVTYHLFLAFLVITAEKGAGISMPLSQTILTHAACLAVIVGLGMGRHAIPFFSIIRLFVPGMAPFEVNWLFGGGDRRKRATLEAAIGGPVAARASVASTPAAPRPTTAEDYEAFLKLMHEGGKRPFRKPGVTVKQEFELWAAAQAKARAAAAAKAAAAAAMPPGANRSQA
ncbi:MAG: hypothetical protein P4L26_10945 [Terracidiphilus sp.]|jgi:hypothetical protein|nr:hypothetical protein [Terracidiphilus sp.]